MLNNKVFSSLGFGIAVLAASYMPQQSFANNEGLHVKILRSGEAFVAKSRVGVVGPVVTTVGDTGHLSPSGIPTLSNNLIGVTIPSLLAAGLSTSMTQGTANGSHSEASLSAVAASLPASVTLTAIGLASEAHAFCAGEHPVVFASTRGNGLVIGGIPIGITGEFNQHVTFPGGTAIINEQIVTQKRNGHEHEVVGKQIEVNAIHIIAAGLDLILGHAEADVKCLDSDRNIEQMNALNLN